jgi:NAD(P)-dependent dehydrogenase (short-subunit alcohol dehydrogenase family)
MAVVLITGCSSGFGLATAVAFARRGDQVIAAVRDATRADALVSAAGSASLEVIEMDVTDDDSVAAATASAQGRFGPVDVLVNNAGVARYGAIEQIPWTWAREMFETNFWGALRVTRAVLPAMRERNAGTVVNVSSVAARLHGVPVAGLYAASKHALGAASEALAIEVAPFGIDVALVEPGWYRTRALENAKVTDDPSSPYHELEAAVAAADTESFLAAPGPEEVATAIVERVERGGPLHVLVGEDAITTHAATAGLTFEEWAAMLAEPAEA